jgi:LPS sulfotransferase NodH
MNHIGEALLAQGVVLPDRPLDLSGALQDAGVRQSYIIVMTGRSGSTWLASALKSVPGAGNPHEYFSEEALPWYSRKVDGQSLSDLVTDMFRRHKTGQTFGFKIDPRRLKALSAYMDVAATFEPSHTAWIDMRRWNIVKQAFSFARARRSGRWHAFEGKAQEVAPTSSVTDEEVWTNLNAILMQEREIETFYRRTAIFPLKIVYEEIYDSKPDILMRVLHEIDPNRDWPDIGQIKGATQKLASEDDAAEELAFLKRHRALVARIMRERDTIRPEELFAKPTSSAVLPVM